MDLYLHVDLRKLEGTVAAGDSRARDVPTPPPPRNGSDMLEDLDLRLDATRAGASLPDEN